MDQKTEKTEKQELNELIPYHMNSDWNLYSALPLNWEKSHLANPTNFLFYSEKE